MVCWKNSIKSNSGSVPVHLNVYDLTSINGYAYWVGLGVYHSGVQVHGVEYAFGAHEYPTTGIFEGEPKQCDGFTFRKAILIGWTEKGLSEVRRVMEELAGVYKGNDYNLITKNCNHFSKDVCIRLTGNSIPRWVNRLAKIGLFCNCIVPQSLSSIKVRHHNIKDKDFEEDKKIDSSKRFTPPPPPQPPITTMRSPSSSSSSPAMATTRRGRSRNRSKTRRSLAPSSPYIFRPSSS